jgi:hypothetical protein
MKKVAIVHVLLLLGILYLLSSCRDCVEGNGVRLVETREIPVFHTIVSSTSFDVHVEEDTVLSLTIQGDETILPFVSTEVVSGVLEVRVATKRCLKPDLPVIVRIKTPAVDVFKVTNSGSGIMILDGITNYETYVALTGSGNIEINDLLTDYLNARVTGSGLFKTFGFAQESLLEMSGSGIIDTDNLTQEVSTIRVSGSGSIYAFVKYDAYNYITGSGDIFLKGGAYPHIKALSGTGNVFKNGYCVTCD